MNPRDAPAYYYCHDAQGKNPECCLSRSSVGEIEYCRLPRQQSKGKSDSNNHNHNHNTANNNNNNNNEGTRKNRIEGRWMGVTTPAPPFSRNDPKDSTDQALVLLDELQCLEYKIQYPPYDGNKSRLVSLEWWLVCKLEISIMKVLLIYI
jgi:hypothetical protein